MVLGERLSAAYRARWGGIAAPGWTHTCGESGGPGRSPESKRAAAGSETAGQTQLSAVLIPVGAWTCREISTHSSWRVAG